VGGTLPFIHVNKGKVPRAALVEYAFLILVCETKTIEGTMSKLFNLEVNSIFFSFGQSISKQHNFSVFWSSKFRKKIISILKITQNYPKNSKVAKKYKRMPKPKLFLSPNLAKSTYG
jgi:hypothetical protein